jgi:hypothetical protein
MENLYEVTIMYLNSDQENAIAQGKVIAFLLMGRNPCPLNVIFAAEKLQLQPEEISAALRALEVEGRIELVLTRAIVTLKDVPPPELVLSGVEGSDSRLEATLSHAELGAIAEEVPLEPETKRKGGAK